MARFIFIGYIYFKILLSLYSVPLYKRILSFLYPIRIWKGSSLQNKVLELLLYQNQYQLATEDALYSDGTRYRPLVLAFNELKTVLPNVKSVLVLGTGLGSAVQILDSKKIKAEYTLVDIDKTVLNLAKNYLSKRSGLSFVCADAVEFMNGNAKKYDLVIIDVFLSRVVPGSVIARAFLSKCKNAVTNGSYIVVNYIISTEEEWQRVSGNITSVFPDHKIIGSGINRIIIAKV